MDLRYLLVALLGWLTSGCFSVLVDAQAGGVSSTRFEEGRYGVAGQIGGGFSASNDTSAERAGAGVSFRGKVTRDVKQFAFSPHAYFLLDSWVTPYGRLGVNLLQAERVDGESVFGMFSPYSEIGFVATPFIVSGFAEYDLRFGADDEPFVGIMVGLGEGFSTKSVRDAADEIVR